MRSIDARAAARGLRQLIESEAEATEDGSTMTDTVVAAIDDAGLFGLLVPTELGGLESDPATIIDVCEELSYADGATGWAYAQNTTVGAYSAYLDLEYAAPLASARAAAGMFAPLGTAEEVDGGYRISGSYKFGSGSGHADYMGGSALVTRDGEIIGIDDGVMPVIGFIIPTDRVEMRGNWDVMGLRGTGSYDFDVPEQFVESGATWWIFPPAIAPSVSGGSLYGLGAVVVGTISSVAWAIGVAQRALDEVAEIARAGRARLGSDPLAEQMIFQRGLGLHTTAVEGARVLAKHSYTAAMQAVDDGVDDDEFHQRIRATKAVATYVTEVAKAATTFAWESSGSAGMRNPSVLQRCFRDMYVGSGHQVFDQRNYIEVAKATLGLDLAGF